MDYFPMDTVMDSKFQAFEELHGNDGFVWIVKFWQKAYMTEDGIIDLKGIHGVIVAKTARIHNDKQTKMIRDAIELHLIEHLGDEKYTSNGIQKRIKSVNEKRKYDRNYHKKGLSERKHNENNTNRAETKVNKSKLNKNKYNPESDCSFFDDEDFQEVWKDWMFVKTKKKASKTDRVIKSAIKRIMQWSDGDKSKAIAIVAKSADCGWTDIYEPKNGVSEKEPKTPLQRLKDEFYETCKDCSERGFDMVALWRKFQDEVIPTKRYGSWKSLRTFHDESAMEKAIVFLNGIE